MADPDPQFCPRCGTARVPDMPFCPKCGLSVADIAEGTWSEARVSGVSRVPPVVIAAIVVAAGLIAFGLLTRLQFGGGPGPGGQVVPNASLVPAAPITGLSILSPTDGQVVVAKEITVIGIAPPGLTITQDISFGLDQHALVDGTGHWAIKVGLNEGRQQPRLSHRRRWLDPADDPGDLHPAPDPLDVGAALAAGVRSKSGNLSAGRHPALATSATLDEAPIPRSTASGPPAVRDRVTSRRMPQGRVSRGPRPT